MLDATEAARVLRNVERPRGEAARGPRQGLAAPDLHLELWPRSAVGLERLQQFPDEKFALFGTRHPAHQTVLLEQLQALVVVDVQSRATDEGAPSLAAELDRSEVVRLDDESTVPDQAAHGADLGLCFDQRQGGKHHLFAGLGERFRDDDPVAGTQFATLAAHGFAKMDDVDRPRCNITIEREGALTRPEPGIGSEGKAHRQCQARW